MRVPETQRESRAPGQQKVVAVGEQAGATGPGAEAAQERGGRGGSRRLSAGGQEGAGPDPPPAPAEKVSSLGKDWHRFCLRCEHCSKTLTPGGHAEVSPSPGQGGGPGSPDQAPALMPCPLPSMTESPSATSPAMPRCSDPKVPVARAEERKASGPPKGPS
ncbi:hypothetical protein E2I00_006042, partial [Balaenoptera physalus]